MVVNGQGTGGETEGCSSPHPFNYRATALGKLFTLEGRTNAGSCHIQGVIIRAKFMYIFA